MRRMRLSQIYDGHEGCVNTIHFDSTGKLLLAGGDSKRLHVWDVQRHKELVRRETGHRRNIFSAIFLRGLTYAASCSRDGEVRLTHVARNTSAVAYQHARTCYNVVGSTFDPNVFFSCSEDKTVRRFDLRGVGGLDQGNVLESETTGYNTFALHPRREELMLVGCSSDPVIMLYDQRMTRSPLLKYAPYHLLSQSAKNVGSRKLGRVTCVKFSSSGDSFIASYANDYIYSFDTFKERSDMDGIAKIRIPKSSDAEPKVIWGSRWEDTGPLSRVVGGCRKDEAAGSGDEGAGGSASNLVGEEGYDVEGINAPARVFKGHRNGRTVIKQCNYFGYNDECVVSGSDDGRIYFWESGTGRLIQALNADHRVVNCVQTPPTHNNRCPPLLLASSGIDYSVKLWEPNNSKPTHPVGGGIDALHVQPVSATEFSSAPIVQETLGQIVERNEQMRVRSIENNELRLPPSEFLQRMIAIVRIQRRMRRMRQEGGGGRKEENDDQPTV